MMTMSEKAIAAYLAGDLGGVRAAYRVGIVQGDELTDGPESDRTCYAHPSDESEITVAPRKAA